MVPRHQNLFSLDGHVALVTRAFAEQVMVPDANLTVLADHLSFSEVTLAKPAAVAVRVLSRSLLRRHWQLRQSRWIVNLWYPKF